MGSKKLFKIVSSPALLQLGSGSSFEVPPPDAALTRSNLIKFLDDKNLIGPVKELADAKGVPTIDKRGNKVIKRKLLEGIVDNVLKLELVPVKPVKVPPPSSISSISGDPNKTKSVETGKDKKLEEATKLALGLSTECKEDIGVLNKRLSNHDDRLNKLEEKNETKTSTSSGTSSWRVPLPVIFALVVGLCIGIGGCYWHFQSRSSSSMANHGAHNQNADVLVEVEGVLIQVGSAPSISDVTPPRVKVVTSRAGVEHVQSGASSSSPDLSLTTSTSGAVAPTAVSDDGMIEEVGPALANTYVTKKTFYMKRGYSERDAAGMAYRDVNDLAIAGAQMKQHQHNHEESLDHASNVAKDMMDTAKDIHKESEAAEEARHKVMVNAVRGLSRENKILILALFISSMVGRMVFSPRFLLKLFMAVVVLMAAFAFVLFWYGPDILPRILVGIIAFVEKFFSLGPWILKGLAFVKSVYDRLTE